MWVMPHPVILIASGDLRPAANQLCWPAQKSVEDAVSDQIRKLGHDVERGHPIDAEKGHGFIDSQRYGMEVFRQIPTDAPVVVVEAVWQYSHHVLAGLTTHRGPILTVANWSGLWPGLVGMLNLNGSLTKAGVKYSTLWSTDFQDAFFLDGLRRWLEGRLLRHDDSHVQRFTDFKVPRPAEETGRELARQLRTNKAIMGVFDGFLCGPTELIGGRAQVTTCDENDRMRHYPHAILTSDRIRV
jgi:hypothetical protein